MKPRQDGIHSNRTRVLTTVQRVRDPARVNSILPAMSQSAAFFPKEGRKVYAGKNRAAQEEEREHAESTTRLARGNEQKGARVGSGAVEGEGGRQAESRPTKSQKSIPSFTRHYKNRGDILK